MAHNLAPARCPCNLTPNPFAFRAVAHNYHQPPVPVRIKSFVCYSQVALEQLSLSMHSAFFRFLQRAFTIYWKENRSWLENDCEYFQTFCLIIRLWWWVGWCFANKKVISKVVSCWYSRLYFVCFFVRPWFFPSKHSRNILPHECVSFFSEIKRDLVKRLSQVNCTVFSPFSGNNTS